MAERPGELICAECGADVWAAAGGTAHHWGGGLDDIDRDLDGDHVAVAITDGSPPAQGPGHG